MSHPGAGRQTIHAPAATQSPLLSARHRRWLRVGLCLAVSLGLSFRCSCSFLAGTLRADDSPPAVAKPKTASDVILFRGEYPGWPWIARTPAGKLVCVWREGTEHDHSASGRLLWSQSSDEGRTWADARLLYDQPQIDDRNVAVVCLTETDWLACFNSYTQERVSRVWTIRSRDAGEHWSEPQLVCELDARTRSAPVRLRTGELLLPFYRAPGDQSLVARSVDDGKNWSVVEIANSPGFVGDEWDLAELPDGRLAGIIRNSAPAPDPADRGWFYLVESHDRGASWSAARRTNLRDQRSTSPAQIFVHHGKPVVLYADARMVSVSLATTADRQLLEWNVTERLPAYAYRADLQPIADGSYPVSVFISGNRRLIVDYLHDGDLHAIAGYFVELPEAWQKE